MPPLPDATAADEGWGQATPEREIMDKQGRVHAVDISIYGY
jgi:hypothetical protein